jgi:hypothetical protein
MGKNHTGRPSKFNRKRAAAILDAIRKGATRSAAAASAGVSERSLYEWQQEFPQFSQSIKKADAEAEMAMIDVIRTAAEKGTWQAAAWWLERRHPESWRRRSSVTVLDAHQEQPTDDPQERARRIAEIYGINIDGSQNIH